MRRLTLLATPLVALALARNASAETRTHSIGQQEVTTPTYFSCRSYGYAFDVNAVFRSVRWSIFVRDDSGRHLMEIRMVDFTGTLSRSDDPSKTVPYIGAFILTQDFVAGTITNSGLIRESWSPSGDFIALRLGEVVTNTATGAVLSVSSPLAAGPQYQQAVCGYLAGL